MVEGGLWVDEAHLQTGSWELGASDVGSYKVKVVQTSDIERK